MYNSFQAKDAEQARHDRQGEFSADEEARTSDAKDLADDERSEEPLASPSVVDSEQFLVVYPESLVLVRLRKDAIRESAFGLTQLVLLSYSSPLSRCDDEAGSEELSESGVSFWSYCETAEEISLIVTEVHMITIEDHCICVG